MKIAQYRYEKDKLILRTLDLSALVKNLQTETKSKPVSTMRERIHYTLPNKQSPYVQRLPILAFGGTFRKSGHKAAMRQYSGLLLLVVNQLADGKEAALVREQAASMPQTLLTFIGSSGKSVKIIVPFTLPNGKLPDTPKQIALFHAEAYQRAVKHYQPQLERNISLKEPTPERGCRMSFDPDLYYNPEAVVIHIDQPLKMPDDNGFRAIRPAPANSIQRMMPGLEQNSRIATLFSVALVEAVRKNGKIIDNNRKPIFTDLAQNCFNAGLEEEEAVRCTLLYEDLLPHEAEIRLTFRSVSMLKKVFGQNSCIPEAMGLSMQLEEFMQRRYAFRYNTVSDEVEFWDHSLISYRFKSLTKQARNSICIEAQKEGIKVWDKDIDRYVNSDNVLLYKPIEDYLMHLPDWNGKDHIRELARRVATDNLLWANHFYRWFLSMVAHWLQLDTEHGNSTSPLLIGKQGCGKSTFCVNILPPELRNYYAESVDFSKRREAELALHRYALINIDEFDSVKASQQSYLKHVLQKASVNTRLPYQTATRQLGRYATFIGTSNNMDVLTDPTGSRRFICVEVNGVIDYTQPIDYEQLYAQAIAALTNKERYWFTHEEEATITAGNHYFKKTSAIEELFHLYFCIGDTNENNEYLTAAQIVKCIKQKETDFTPKDSTIVILGRYLKGLNIPSKRSKYGMFYLVSKNTEY